jgi:hypothetical protein
MQDNKVAIQSLIDRDAQINQYLNRVKQIATWATQTEVFAMAHMLKTDIYIYTKSGDRLTWMKFSGQCIDSTMQVNEKSIYLYHTNLNHYDVAIDISRDTVEQNQILVFQDNCRENREANLLEKYFSDQKMQQHFKDELKENKSVFTLFKATQGCRKEKIEMARSNVQKK